MVNSMSERLSRLYTPHPSGWFQCAPANDDAVSPASYWRTISGNESRIEWRSWHLAEVFDFVEEFMGTPLMYQFALFVGGLSYDTNEPVLKDSFRKHGEIIEVKVICDHVSGKSKGYGFVKYTSETEASTALKEMDGQLLDGRQIRVEFAHKG